MATFFIEWVGFFVVTIQIDDSTLVVNSSTDWVRSRSAKYCVVKFFFRNYRSKVGFYGVIINKIQTLVSVCIGRLGKNGGEKYTTKNRE